MDATSMFVTVAAALVSGLLGAGLTLIIQHYGNIKKEKRECLKTLMSFRYDIVNEKSINILNSIDVVFYKDKHVISAWKNFRDATNKSGRAPTQENFNAQNDKYLKLIEEIAKVSGNSKIDWEDVKNFYFPKGMADKMNAEIIIRNAQVSAALQPQQGKQNNADQQFVLDIVKDPNAVTGLITLMKALGASPQDFLQKGDDK